MAKEISITQPTACIVEGGAERAILDTLLNHGKLIFSKENLMDGEILRRCSAREFETNYLNKEFDEPITVIRVIDSRREKFSLGKGFQEKIRLVTVITAPEIDVLIIIAEGAYKHFLKKKMKPSEYCKGDLGIKDVKSKKFVEEYFQDVDKLVNALREYKRLKKIKKMSTPCLI